MPCNQQLGILKKNFLLLIVSLFFLGCSKDKINYQNPYIPNYPVNYVIDLNLPQFSQLQFASNAKLITDLNVGANGIIVFNTGSGYTAFDANCPNQYISDCSQMYLKGIKAVCPCDELEYDLFTGSNAGQPLSMKPYRVEIQGNLILIRN